MLLFRFLQSKNKYNVRFSSEKGKPMSERKQEAEGSRKLPPLKRRSLSISQHNLIKEERLALAQPLPLVIQPVAEKVDLIAWAASNREYLLTKLRECGGILFRGFEIQEAHDFEQYVTTISQQPLAYGERSSPRSQVYGNIYTSTDYPPDQRIYLHNENSYQRAWPLKIFFFCHTPAQQGGETPIADCQRVYERIDPLIREKFRTKKILYVRNFGDGFGLPWQTVFQTSDKAAVEAYCHAAGIATEWKDGNRLRTTQIRPAIVHHPQTGAPIWFNHATFFHISTLAPSVQEALQVEFQEQDLPNNTYYGDQTAIEPDVLDHLRMAYDYETVKFPWQKGDIVMLDNMRVAHGREPFSGPRKVLVAMSEPFSSSDLE